MHADSLSLSLYLLSDGCESWTGPLVERLRARFPVFEVRSQGELRALLKRKLLFSHLVLARVDDPENVAPLRRFGLPTPRVPCVLFGKLTSEAVEPLLQLGFGHVMRYPRENLLLERLEQLARAAQFRLNWADFGFEVDGCRRCWSRRCLNRLAQEPLLCRTHNVSQLAKHLGTTTAALERALRQDGLPSPKQLLLCARCYHAAYLLSRTHWTLESIAQTCGFRDPSALCRAFQQRTGLTPGTFRNNHRWQDFPELVQKAQ